MTRPSPFRAELEELSGAGLLRTVRALAPAGGRLVRDRDRELVNLCSNDYLGLANDPRLAAALAGSDAGAGAARLLTGTRPEHVALEADLAAWSGQEAALLFNTGYCANVGVLQALLRPGDAVFSDQLDHASIIDGCRLSRAEVRVYRHGDLDHLAELLAADGPRRRRVLVTESLFGMDGDLALLAALRELADRHDALLMVDEAHALGVLGPSGRGVAADLGVPVDVLVGTLGKAFGCFGAFAAGSADLVALLVNRARTFVFTTAPPPALARTARVALAIAAAAEGDARRTRLAGLCGMLRSGLAALGIPGAASPSQIFPLQVGEPLAALEVADRMRDRGLLVQAIRPPTVPAGTARLRVSLSAAHEPADVERLLGAASDLRSHFRGTR